MSPRELFQAGKLDEAIEALGAEVRDNPTDARRRTFLFELLCFKGDYDRAEKHLNILSDASPDSKVGAMLYYSALHAERLRRDLFERKEYPVLTDATPRGGTLNGEPFEVLEDADPRGGPRLELFAAGAYLWIPLAHIESIEMEPPKRLREDPGRSREAHGRCKQRQRRQRTISLAQPRPRGDLDREQRPGREPRKIDPPRAAQLRQGVERGIEQIGARDLEQLCS